MSIPKIISIWLAALVIAGGSLFVYKNYFVKDLEKNAERITDPTLSEVEEWKTYRNEKYGFEIKYPFYFEIESTTTSKLLLRTGDKKGSIDIRAYENPNMRTSIHVYCESPLGKNALFCNDINNWEKVKAEIRAVNLNNIEITSVSKNGSASTTYFFIKDKLTFGTYIPDPTLIRDSVLLHVKEGYKSYFPSICKISKSRRKINVRGWAGICLPAYNRS